MSVAALLAIALAIVYLALARSPAVSGRIVAQAVFLLPFVVALACGIVAWRRSKGRSRRFWLLLAVSVGLLLAGESIASVTAISRIEPAHYTGWSLVFYASTALVFIPMTMSLTSLGERRALAQVTAWFDVLALATLAYLIIHFGVLRQLGAAAGPSAWDLAVVGLISTFGLLVVGVMLYAAADTEISTWRQWETTMVVGLGAYGAVCVGAPLYGMSAAGQIPHAWADAVSAGWLLSMSIIAYAAMLRVLSAEQAEDRHVFFADRRPERPWLSTVLVSAAVAGAASIAAVLAFVPSVSSVDVSLLVGGATVLVASVLARFATVIAAGRLLVMRSQADAVTGLGNHQALIVALEAQVAQAVLSGEPLATVVVDIDGYRRVETSLGPAEAQRILREMARALAAVAGRGVSVFRSAGEEFTLLVPRADADSAKAVGETARSVVALSTTGAGVPMTASVGVAVSPEHGSDAVELLAHAREACRWVRSHGTNAVSVYDPERAHGESGEEAVAPGTAQRQALRMLAAAVDMRTRGRRSRSADVESLARALATEIGLTDQRASEVGIAAALSDVGYVSMDEALLEREAELAEDDSRAMREHPIASAHIFGPAAMPEAAAWVRSHHEHWDGTGYPDGLAGRAIPLESRIISIVDAFDAMLNERSHRQPLAIEAALSEIASGLGTRFDPEVGSAFVRMVHEGRITHSQLRGAARGR